MTISEARQSGVRPSPDAAIAVAAEHQAHQRAMRLATIAAIIETFRTLNPKAPIPSWMSGIGSKIFLLISMAQESSAAESQRYAARALASQGVVADLPLINARTFAGLAGDNRPLDTLLVGAPLRVAQRHRAGQGAGAALMSGEKWLTMVAETAIIDAGRAADSVSIAAARNAQFARIRAALNTTMLSPEREADIARRLAERNARATDPALDDEIIVPRKGRALGVSVGYVRMLNPPSCDKCVPLAGRWYRWNAGFLRHPLCDCRHIPAIEALEGDMTIDPQAYFDSLTEEEQNQTFGKANSQAIREGADIGQIVNAHRKGALYVADDGRRYTREGLTKRSFAQWSRRDKGLEPMVVRPTVWQIYKDARGNRDAAVRALRNFGYIL